MNARKLSLILFSFTLLLSACTTEIPNVRVCSVAGVMSAGADCAYSLEEKTEEMTLDEFIAFLEPAEDHGPALCLSSDHYTKLKIALEQLCTRLGSGCSKEVKEEIKTVSARVDRMALRRKQKVKPVGTEIH